jgi:3-methyladenine DNA glycosylase/8-oxoguanine DNA glycosylase
VENTRSMFGALARAIVYQQLTGKAAATIHARVAALFPNARGAFTPADILAVGEENLRGCGLSRAKTAALRDLAGKVRDGTVPTLAEARRLSDDEIVERLVVVRGIGRWTAEMLLMFRLGRPDVLPVDDYGVRKGFRIAFAKRALPSKDQLERRGEKWRPYRSVASWYMWRACDLEADRKRATKAPAKR